MDHKERAFRTGLARAGVNNSCLPHSCAVPAVLVLDKEGKACSEAAREVEVRVGNLNVGTITVKGESWLI